MGTQPSVQSPFQKSKFCNSSHKVRKSRNQTLLLLSNITGFLYFIPNISSRIAGEPKVNQFPSFNLPLNVFFERISQANTSIEAPVVATIRMKINMPFPNSNLMTSVKTSISCKQFCLIK